MPRYFLVLPEEGTPRPWDLTGEPISERADTRYFGEVLARWSRCWSALISTST